MSIAAPDRSVVHSTLQLNVPGLGLLSAELLLQHNKQNRQVASGAQRVILASCELTQGVGDM